VKNFCTNLKFFSSGPGSKQVTGHMLVTIIWFSPAKLYSKKLAMCYLQPYYCYWHFSTVVIASCEILYDQKGEKTWFRQL